VDSPADKRAAFRDLLACLDLRARPEQARFRERMLLLLDEEPGCFDRDTYPAHFTGSALVVSQDGERILLNHHRKLGRWMQFGGHCDGDADLLGVAMREAWEESGIKGLTPLQTTPFDLDIHTLPPTPKEPGHFHYDVRFLLVAPAGAEPKVSEESLDVRWFTSDALDALALDSSVIRMVARWRAINDFSASGT